MSSQAALQSKSAGPAAGGTPALPGHALRVKPKKGSSQIRLALISCGLGNVTRGFEVSTARLYKALSADKQMDVRLYTGGKYETATKTIWNIPRDLVIKSPIGLLSHINDRRVWEFSYGVEQISFGLFLWPELVKWRPDVVWTKEVPFAYFLLHYRKMFNLKLKVIFANGGAFRPQTYKDFDYIQHLETESYQEAQKFGIPEEKMTLLTNCIDLQLSPKPRDVLRAQFGYTPNDWIVICVAAWNRHHKRIDYVINEVAQMKNDNVKLLFCGHPEPETPILKKLAQEKLPGRVQWLTLAESQVQEALQAADVFVMSSLHEALGNSLVEAVLAGTPVVSHEHGASKFLLREHERMTDLSQPGNLTRRLLELMQSPPERDDLIMLQERAREQFSQETTVQRFYEMVARVSNLPPRDPQPVGSYDLSAEN